MLLVFQSAKVEDIAVGDEIGLSYLRPGQHGNERVGILTGFQGNPKTGRPYLQVWDYTVTPPSYRSFRVDHVRNLGRLVPTDPEELLRMDNLRAFQLNLAAYARRLYHES